MDNKLQHNTYWRIQANTEFMKLVSLRAALGVSRYIMAKRLHLAYSQLYRYETGEYRVPLDIYMAYAHELKTLGAKLAQIRNSSLLKNLWRTLEKQKTEDKKDAE